MIWRLLNAQQNAAQELGVIYAQAQSAHAFSLANLYKMAQFSPVAARQLAHQLLQGRRAQVIEELGDSFQLIEGRWDDTRNFGMQFLRDIPSNYWTLPLLVRLCDSNREDVQALGHELLDQYIKPGDHKEFLLRIIQHPQSDVSI